MASGHVNRANRPNTWLHRPRLQREDSPCRLGAVHTWHKADITIALNRVRFWDKADIQRTHNVHFRTHIRHQLSDSTLTRHFDGQILDARSLNWLRIKTH